MPIRNDRRPWMVLLVMAVLMGPRMAPSDGGGASWRTLATAERGVLAPMRGDWDALPPDRQRQLLGGARHWLQLSAAGQERAWERHAAWLLKSDAERQRIRRQFQWFQGLMPEQQQRLRQARIQFQQLSADQRGQLRQRWQRMTPEARRSAQLEIQRWNALPETVRRQIRERYATASPEARRQMQRQWQAPPMEPGLGGHRSMDGSGQAATPPP